jgi:hypothetical protein
MGCQKDTISAFGIHLGVIFIGRYCGRTVRNEEKRRYSDEERFEWSSPMQPIALVLTADLFCRLLPAYGQEQAVYFVRLAPPQDANHTVCALINHIND